ncbi:MAG TPA: nuclear transport factor 2 family protein [Thermoanaerobaculia bacterium]|nr:nuclear transport factor 2 family protein [Thermoanaerobaculia bacterium]
MSTATTEPAAIANADAKRPSRTHREVAIAFLRAAAAGRARDAFAKHAATGFRHHNPYYPADADSLAAGIEENAAEFPDKDLTVHHVLEDGDYVAVHSFVQMQPGGAGIAVVHLFRFEGDQIAELWDIAQQLPADSPNENGAF